MSYQSSAICSFCSREDSSVKVVCRKYCLICRRCQLLPATRQLIVDHYKIDMNDSGNHSSSNSHDSNASPDIAQEVKNSSSSNSGEMRGCCPICSSPMTNNMFLSIQNSMEDNQDTNVFVELDLGYKPNLITEFLNTFKNTYGNIGYKIYLNSDEFCYLDSDNLIDYSNLLSGLKNQRNNSISSFSPLTTEIMSRRQSKVNINEILSPNNNSNGNFISTTRPSSSSTSNQMIDIIETIRPSTALTQINQQNHNNENTMKSTSKTVGKLSKKKSQATNSNGPQSAIISNTVITIKDSSYDYYTTIPPILTYHEGLSTFADCLVAVWQSSTRGIEESIVAALKRIVSRKKATNRSNDFRFKSFIDFVSMANAVNSSSKSPSTLLMGKLIGLHPIISDIIRPVYGSITTSIYLLSFVGDKVIASNSKEIYDSVKNSPSPIEFKTKMEKLSNTKLIPIRKALQIIEYLTSIEEPHWCMSPLTAMSVSVGGKVAWESDSICRLIHLIVYAIQGDDALTISKSSNNLSGSLPNPLYRTKSNISTTFNSVGSTERCIDSIKKQSNNSNNSNDSNCNHNELSGIGDDDDNHNHNHIIEENINQISPSKRLSQSSTVAIQNKRNSPKQQQQSTQSQPIQNTGSFNAASNTSPSTNININVNTNVNVNTNTNNNNIESSSTLLLRRLQNLSTKTQEFWNAIPYESWKDDIDFKTVGSIIHPTECLPGIAQHGPGAMRKMSSTASMSQYKGLVNSSNNITRTRSSYGSSNLGDLGRLSSSNLKGTSDNSHDNSNPNIKSVENSFIKSEYFKSARTLARNTGKGVISPIDFKTAASIIPSDIMITPAELSLICISAWEAEYEKVVQMQSSSVMVTLRRPAVKGTLDPKQAKLTFPEKLLLKRILTWYHTVYNPSNAHLNFKSKNRLNSNDSDDNNNDDDNNDSDDDDKFQSSPNMKYHLSKLESKSRSKSNEDDGFQPVDWIIVKTLAEQRLLPFNVPESLYSKTPAELNYHSLQIYLEDERRKAIEREEDENIETNGPYSPLPYTLISNPILTGVRLRNGLKSVDLLHSTETDIENIAALSVGRDLSIRSNITTNTNSNPNSRLMSSSSSMNPVDVAPISSNMVEDMQRQQFLINQTIGSTSGMKTGLTISKIDTSVSLSLMKPGFSSKPMESISPTLLNNNSSNKIKSTKGSKDSSRAASRIHSRISSRINSRSNSRATSPSLNMMNAMNGKRKNMSFENALTASLAIAAKESEIMSPTNSSPTTLKGIASVVFNSSTNINTNISKKNVMISTTLPLKSASVSRLHSPTIPSMKQVIPNDLFAASLLLQEQHLSISHMNSPHSPHKKSPNKKNSEESRFGPTTISLSPSSTTENQSTVAVAVALARLSHSPEKVSTIKPSSILKRKSSKRIIISSDTDSMPIRTTIDMIAFDEGSVSVRTNPNDKKPIPGSRGSMYPESLYPSKKQGKFTISLPDLIDNHPNLLTKANMLVSNTLLLDKKDGRLTYGSAQPFISRLLEQDKSCQNRKSSISSPFKNLSLLLDDSSTRQLSPMKTHEDILLNYQDRLHYSASTLDMKVSKRTEEIFYKPVVTQSCPPLEEFDTKDYNSHHSHHNSHHSHHNSYHSYNSHHNNNNSNSNNSNSNNSNNNNSNNNNSNNNNNNNNKRDKENRDHKGMNSPTDSINIILNNNSSLSLQNPLPSKSNMKSSFYADSYSSSYPTAYSTPHYTNPPSPGRGNHRGLRSNVSSPRHTMHSSPFRSDSNMNGNVNDNMNVDTTMSIASESLSMIGSPMSPSGKSLQSVTDLMTISSQQYLESFQLEFLVFIRELQGKPIIRVSAESYSSPVKPKAGRRFSLGCAETEAYITNDSFILRHIYLSNPDDFIKIVDRFINPHISVMQKLYLEDLSIGYNGALLLNASKLNQSNNLTEVNISQNELGDRGVIAILEVLSIKNESKALSLNTLILKKNDMAFANDGLKVLSEFPSLTYLDISYNSISLDVRKQQNLFSCIFTSLKELRYLSIAHNTIQDVGCELLLSIISQHYLPNLEILDLSKSYITSKCIPSIQKMIYDTKLFMFRLLLLQQNIFTHDQIHNLKYPNIEKEMKQYQQHNNHHHRNQSSNGHYNHHKNIAYTNDKSHRIPASINPFYTMESSSSLSSSAAAVAAPIVSNTSDGFILNFSEPYEKTLRVVLDGVYNGIESYLPFNPSTRLE